MKPRRYEHRSQVADASIDASEGSPKLKHWGILIDDTLDDVIASVETSHPVCFVFVGHIR